jgi:hypothetical protein
LQLAELTWRNNLIGLADKAIGEGSREAFYELIRMYKELKGSDKEKTISSYIYQVKRIYINASKYKGYRNFTYKRKPVDLEKIKTSVIIKDIKITKNLGLKYGLVKHLAKRKEKGVPELLIQCIQSDNSLDVVARCVDSFESITGYRSVDVFGGDHLFKYWNENKIDINEKLKNLDSDFAD